MATWPDAVKKMAEYYFHNIHTYWGGPNNKAAKSRTAYSCSLVGNSNVYDDCSGFVSACLVLFGVFEKNYAPRSANFSSLSDKCAKKLQEKGFKYIPYSISALKPYDIVTKSGHIEIYIGVNSAGKSRAFGWGNTHDGMNGHESMPCAFNKMAYTYIWRHNGTSVDVNLSGDAGMTMQQQVNIVYGTGGYREAYPVHTEYDTYTGVGGNLFADAKDNAYSQAVFNSSKNKELLGFLDSSLNRKDHTRIYSTNDAKIYLDELRIPVDEDYVNKGVTQEDVKNYKYEGIKQKKEDTSTGKDSSSGKDTSTGNDTSTGKNKKKKK